MHIIKVDKLAVMQWFDIDDYHPATCITMPPALDPDVPEVVYHIKYLPAGDYTGLVDPAVIHITDEKGKNYKHNISMAIRMIKPLQSKCH